MARANARSARPVKSVKEGLAKWEGMSPMQVLDSIEGNFLTETKELVTKDGDPVPNKVAAWNPLTKHVMGIVSDGWRGLHNKLIAESMQELSTAMGMPVMITNAYNINSGSLIGIEAQIGNATSIVPDDDVIPIVKIVQGNHGNSPLCFNFELMRLICANGMRAPVEGMSAVFRYKHTKHIESRYSWSFDAVLKNFDVMRDNMIEKFKKLAARKVTDSEAQAFFNEIAKKVIEDKDLKADQTVRELNEVWNHPRQQIAGRNYWGLLNTATEYLQHWGYNSDEQMNLQNINGIAVKMKDEAFRLAVNLAV